MNINNIALVRATNIIPFDGVVKPVSNVPYLCKKSGTTISFMISDWLKEEGIVPPISANDMFSDNYDEKVKENSRIVKEYLPYTSDYNSMVLFSLNGICPDDNEHGFANNTFSDKKVAIIEPLSKHIDDVITLNPTDTAIKDNVVLSDEAIILIDEELYNSLSVEQKGQLNSNNFKIKVFNGSLKDAIASELKNSDKFTSETLSLSSSSGGYMDSDTSSQLKETLNNIALTYNISQVKFFNLLMNVDVQMPKYDLIMDEVNNFNNVYNYYVRMFFYELLQYIGVDEQTANYLSELQYKDQQEQVMKLLKQFGISNYKKFVDNYNKSLEDKRNNNELMCPSDIVSDLKNSKKM